MAVSTFADRVKDTTTTTGTSDMTLSGTAPAGFQNFNDAFSTSVQFHYCIEGGSEWEVGEGHLSASTTLVRDAIFASSNSNNAVNFSAGTKNVFATIPAHSQSGPIWRTAWKDATESRASTTTLTADGQLSFPMLASKGYFIDAWIGVFCESASRDFKFSFVAPAAGQPRIMRLETSLSTTVTDTAVLALPSATVLNFASNNLYGYIHLKGTYENGANAGNFEFQWAQSSSGTELIYVLVGSNIRYFQASA